MWATWRYYGGMNDVILPVTNTLGVVPQRSRAQHARARPSTLPKRGSASFGYISILEELINMSADIRFKGLTPKAEVVCDQKKGFLLGGHKDYEQQDQSGVRRGKGDYYVACRCQECETKPMCLVEEGGRVFTVGRFERHAGLHTNRKWRYTLQVVINQPKNIRIGSWLHKISSSYGVSPDQRIRVWLPLHQEWQQATVTETVLDIERERGHDPQLYHVLRFDDGRRERVILAAELFQIRSSNKPGVMTPATSRLPGAITPSRQCATVKQTIDPGPQLHPEPDTAPGGVTPGAQSGLLVGHAASEKPPHVYTGVSVAKAAQQRKVCGGTSSEGDTDHADKDARTRDRSISEGDTIVHGTSDSDADGEQTEQASEYTPKDRVQAGNRAKSDHAACVTEPIAPAKTTLLLGDSRQCPAPLKRKFAKYTRPCSDKVLTTKAAGGSTEDKAHGAGEGRKRANGSAEVERPPERAKTMRLSDGMSDHLAALQSLLAGIESEVQSKTGELESLRARAREAEAGKRAAMVWADESERKCQELQRRVEALEAENAALQSQNHSLEAECEDYCSFRRSVQEARAALERALGE